MTKSVAEQVEKFGVSMPQGVALEVEASRLIKDLEEVEAILKEIGVSLESQLGISSAARSRSIKTNLTKKR